MELLFMVWASVLVIVLPYIWHLPLLFIPRFQLFQERSEQAINKILTRLKPASSLKSGRTARGFFCGKWYFGFVEETRTPEKCTIVLYILIQPKVMDKLMDLISSQLVIKVYEYEGNIFYHEYRMRTLEFKLDPRSHQLNIVNELTDAIDKGQCTFLLWGTSGGGKSSIAFFLARQLRGALCKSFRPTEPGAFNTLYNSVNPSKNEPLVVLLDEVDQDLDLMLERDVPQNKYSRVTIVNKSSWNIFFDDLERGMYPHTVFILTMNMDPCTFDRKDPSLLRPGRIHLRLSM